MQLAPHHAESVANLVRALEPDQSIRALLLGGSLAHGFAGPDSDVDVLIVVAGEEYRRRTLDDRLHYHNREVCTYDGGYVDGKYVDVEFLELVAASGSDPSRYAYQDARVLFSRLPGIEGLLEEIARFPAHERTERLERFTAQLLAWRWYHSEAVGKSSRYLEVLALHKLVLFSCRLVLTANEMLYPYHKWMLRVTATAPDRPPDFLERLDELLAAPSTALVDEHCRDVLAHYGIDHDRADDGWPTRFMKDTELAWMSGHPPVDDL